jgi:hypothetical protein
LGVKWVGVFLIFRRVGFEIWQCEEERCFVFYINLICFKSSLFGLEKLCIVWLVQAERVFSFFQLAEIQFYDALMSMSCKVWDPQLCLGCTGV